MNRPIPFSKNARSALPIFICFAAGYIIGIIVFIFEGSDLGDSISPDMTSAFDSQTPLISLISCIFTELFCLIITYVLGYTVLAHALFPAVAIYRSALASFSSIFILSGTYPLYIYFIHSVFSLASIIALALCGMLAVKQSSLIRSRQRLSDATHEYVDYTAKTLFFVGVTVILVIVRHVITAIIR